MKAEIAINTNSIIGKITASHPAAGIPCAPTCCCCVKLLPLDFQLKSFSMILDGIDGVNNSKHLPSAAEVLNNIAKTSFGAHYNCSVNCPQPPL